MPNTFPNPASEFVYTRTYSRWIDEKNRREVWSETVNRYVDFLIEERGDKIPPKVIRKIREKILNFEVMASMRAKWAAGPAAKTENVTMYNCSFLILDSPTSFAELFYILMCGTGVGFSVQKEYINDSKYLPEVPKIEFDNKKIAIVEDTRAAWADSLKDLMNSLFEGNDIEFDYTKIRPKGSRLKTMGGRSSGPAPLITLHNFIRETFTNAQGRKLTTLECHDIANQIADSVVVGGVRRSSEISLSDLDDESMRNAKVWPFPSRRFMANNSAIYTKKPSAVEFLKEWSALASSGTGERGIFNLESAKTRSPNRRNGKLITGTNPCVTGDTEILTDDGYKRINSLVNKETTIWNGFEWSKVTPQITGYNQNILNIKFSDGRTLKCTPYHKFHINQNYKHDSIEVLAKDLTIGMKLIKYNFPIIEHGEDNEFAYTQGFISAEGMDNYSFMYVYEPKEVCLKRLKGNICTKNGNKTRFSFNHKPLLKSFVPFNWNLRCKIDWLAGLFDGDGTELKEGGLQLASIDQKFLNDLQKLLSTLGVQSKVKFHKKAGLKWLPDGRGGNKEYYCQDLYRILIGAKQMQDLKKLGLKCERMFFDKYPNRDASVFVTIKEINQDKNSDVVYCFTEPKRHLGIFNGIITGQCGEITLRNKQFCNLSEVIIKEDDDLDSLLEKIETATWIGVIQSTFTHFPYLSKEWKKNCEEERLLGVSLTGQLDNPNLLSEDVLKALKARANKVAKHAAQKMGINTPTAITCVKPSGTVSQLVDSSSGIHPRYSSYYIRRYRINSTDPLLKMIKSQGIKLSPENGQENLKEDDVTTWIVEFPIKSPKNSITRNEMTAIDQLEWYKKVQVNYCEHNASMTVYVKNDEWFEVGNWVYKNWEIVNGISFLPHDGGHYKQAPYEEITEEKYNKLMDNFKPIDYSQLTQFELEDMTEGARVYNCSGERCEIT